MTALASLSLVGFAAMVSAAAIAVSSEPTTHAAGREMMVRAQFDLAHGLKR